MKLYWAGATLALGVCFFYYMRDRYHEDIQINNIQNKFSVDPSSLSEYENLILKKVNNEPLRTRELNKFRMYQMMRKEYRRKHLLDKSAVFNPSPQELEEWYQKQVRISSEPAPVLNQPILSGESAPQAEAEHGAIAIDDLETIHTNATRPSIVPAQDTTKFYEEKAAEYDDEVKWEERGMFMGSKRKWLARQMRGDVLEVACGTGRNVPYFQPDLVKSMTFLDVSRNMVEICLEKFRAAFPNFSNVAFTVGRAEDLASLAASTGADTFKYDTIVESFGLCAHADPVKALQNMESMLKPGGRIVLMEHGRSTYDFLNKYMDERSERRMKTWACRWNLDIGELVDDAGLDVVYERRAHLGTTWLLVCKRPQDPYRIEEKLFLDKLFGRQPKLVSAGKR